GWFRPDIATPATAEHMLQKWDTVGNQRSYLMQRVTNGSVRFLITPDGSTQYTTAGTPPLNISEWYFLVARFTPSTSIEMWLDGAMSAQNISSIPMTIFGSTADFVIGAGVGGGFFAGRAALCFLCAAAVPDATIQTFYNYTSPLFK